MRTTILASALVIAGCASQPPSPAPAPEAAAGQPQEAASDADLEKRRLAEAMKHGYKVVNTDGETLYCRSDWATGSHIQKNTVCLTARQIDELDQHNQRELAPITVPRGRLSSTIP
jgi:hypothetical protein